MFASTVPTIQPLSDHLTLRSISAHAEIERLAAFNRAVHDEQNIDTLTRYLILHHPNAHPDYWLYVEDSATGEIVSSLCLIPWTWRYEEVELRAGEMGIVGTLPAYRNRGLIRAQDRRFKELLRDFDLSQIQGIPYFYRQFGYEYAIPLEGGWRVEAHTIPDAPENAPRCAFRHATLADLPALLRLYDEAACDLSIRVVRDAAIWRYLLTHSPETGTAAETWLALDESNQPIGYWRIERFGFGEGLNVKEASRLDRATAAAALRQFKALAAARGKPYVRLALPPKHILIQTARAWGAHDLGTYAWQIHVPDVARLLRKLAPILERRLAASRFAGLTDTVLLNLYREAFALRFEDGQLFAVESAGCQDKGSIRLPPPQFVPLVFGYRSREELMSAHHDVSIWGESRALIDTLFPKVESYLYTIY